MIFYDQDNDADDHHENYYDHREDKDDATADDFVVADDHDYTIVVNGDGEFTTPIRRRS